MSSVIICCQNGIWIIPDTFELNTLFSDDGIVQGVDKQCWLSNLGYNVTAGIFVIILIFVLITEHWANNYFVTCAAWLWKLIQSLLKINIMNFFEVVSKLRFIFFKYLDHILSQHFIVESAGNFFYRIYKLKCPHWCLNATSCSQKAIFTFFSQNVS